MSMSFDFLFLLVDLLQEEEGEGQGTRTQGGVESRPGMEASVESSTSGGEELAAQVLVLDCN